MRIQLPQQNITIAEPIYFNQGYIKQVLHPFQPASQPYFHWPRTPCPGMNPNLLPLLPLGPQLCPVHTCLFWCTKPRSPCRTLSCAPAQTKGGTVLPCLCINTYIQLHTGSGSSIKLMIFLFFMDSFTFFLGFFLQILWTIIFSPVALLSVFCLSPP